MFRIPFTDVLRYFDEIQLCHLQPDSLTSEIANDEVTDFNEACKELVDKKKQQPVLSSISLLHVTN